MNASNQSGQSGRLQVQHLIADSHRRSRLAAEDRNQSEGQVLHRKVGMAVRAGDPASTVGIVRFIDHCGGRPLAKPCQTAS